MQQPDETQPKRVHPDQVVIPVPSAPNAIGRWTADDEVREYASQFGFDAALEQKHRADMAAKCKCGNQDKENGLASREDRKARRIASHLHGPGCPAFRPVAKVTRHTATQEEVERGW